MSTKATTILSVVVFVSVIGVVIQWDWQAYASGYGILGLCFLGCVIGLPCTAAVVMTVKALMGDFADTADNDRFGRPSDM